MGLLFMEGFDWCASNLTDAVTTGRWGAMTAGFSTASPGRYGTGRYFTSGNNGNYLETKDLGNSSEVIIGFAFKISTVTTKALISFVDNATVQGELQLVSTGELKVTRSTGTQLGISAAGTITAGIWYYIECRYKAHGSSGEVEVKLNGATVSGLNLTSQNTISTANAYTNKYRFVSNTGTVFYDDIYILSTSGGARTAFLGEVRIEALRPTSDGSSTQFTRSTGATNYGTVDETTGDTSGDADYNASSTVGHYDLFGLSDLPSSGTVLGVQLVTRAAKDDVLARSLKNALKVSGYSTRDGSTTLTLASSPQVCIDIYEQNPDTTADWTPSEINSGLETGYKVQA